MVAITLPDGSIRNFDHPVSGAEIAADIGPGLAKNALAIRLDGAMKDLSTVIDRDAEVAIVTSKDPEALDLLRHDAAHVMAEAVQELWPGTQVTIGPSIENGFYYDFAKAEPFTPEDLEQIEAKMAEIVDRDAPLVRSVWDRAKAIETFEKMGEKYKAEIIRDIMPEGEVVTDLYARVTGSTCAAARTCRAVGRVGKAFKLMKLAGAYWRGRFSSNEMLQRIYGTAWPDEKQLKAHLTMLEEAEKRDHRRLGREMEPVPLPGGSAGRRVSGIPNGWKLFQHPHFDYMRHPPGARPATPRSARRRSWTVRPVGALGPLGYLPRAHVHDGHRGRARLRAEADELSGRHPGVQVRGSPATRTCRKPGRRVRQGEPLRALGSPARADAGARVHPGRCAYLLHAPSRSRKSAAPSSN